VADIEENDISPLFGQLHGVAAALAASSARDQDDFSFYAA
jgi:hypothetical protein